MELKDIKELADMTIDAAEGLLKMGQQWVPTIFGISGEEVIYNSIEIENEEDAFKAKEVISSLSNSCEAIVFIMDSYLLEVEEDKIEPDENYKDLSKHKDSQQALICFIYTKDNTCIRRIKHDNKHFFDMGWEKLSNLEGKFENPYKK